MMTFRRLNKDPTNKLQKRNNELAQELHKYGQISIIDKKKIQTDTATARRIYEVPKIHKENYPVTSICSNNNALAEKLCKYLGQILKNLRREFKYNIKDATEFKEKMKNLKRGRWRNGTIWRNIAFS